MFNQKNEQSKNNVSRFDQLFPKEKKREIYSRSRNIAGQKFFISWAHSSLRERLVNNVSAIR